MNELEPPDLSEQSLGQAASAVASSLPAHPMTLGQLEVCVTGPWPINGPAVHVTPQAKELLVRLGWTPPKEEKP